LSAYFLHLLADSVPESATHSSHTDFLAVLSEASIYPPRNSVWDECGFS